MNPRTTLALLILVSALGGYVYYFELGKAAREVDAEAASRQLFKLEPEQVTEIELPLEEGGSARLVRANAGADWRIVAPLETGADRETADALLAALAELRYTLPIPNPGKLEDFGLAEGGARVRVSTPSGVVASFGIGNDSTPTNLTYISAEGERAGVYGIDRAKRATLVPALYRLRDKRLLVPDAAAVRGVKVSADGALLVAARRAPPVASSPQPGAAAGEPATPEATWRIEQPLQDEADGARLQRLLEDFTLARASSFVDEPGDLAEYGLAKPALLVELETESGATQLAIGKQDVKIFARVDAGPVLQMRSRLYEDVPKSLFEYREKRVLNVDESAVQGVELAYPREGETYRFKREGETWKPEQPIEVDPTKLEDVLFRLAALEATGIEDGQPDRAALGLEPPAARVSLSGADGKELARLDLGTPAPGLGVPAVASTSTRVWRVVNDLGEDIPLTLEAFRNSWLKPAGAPETAGEDPVSGAEAAPEGGAVPAEPR